MGRGCWHRRVAFAAAVAAALSYHRPARAVDSSFVSIQGSFPGVAGNSESIGFSLTASSNPMTLKTLAYSGDSAPSEALLEIARDADLFLCEATLAEPREGELRGHLAPVEAVDAFERSGAKRLVIIHRPHELPLDEHLQRATDGDVFEV